MLLQVVGNQHCCGRCACDVGRRVWATLRCAAVQAAAQAQLRFVCSTFDHTSSSFYLLALLSLPLPSPCPFLSSHQQLDPSGPSSVAGKVLHCSVIHCLLRQRQVYIRQCHFLISKLSYTRNQTDRRVTTGVSTGRATPKRLWQKPGSCSGLQLPGAHGHAESAGGPHGGPPCAQGRLPPDDLQTVTCTTAALH